MKQLKWVFLSLLYLSITPHTSTGQDLSHLIPAADYTLINTADDALGLQPPINLINSPFAGDQGVYCNGNYINHGGDSSLVATPYLATLFDSVFALQLEFKIADLDQLWRPAFVCGNSYRYLGLLMGADSSFYALLNNSSSIKIESIKVVVDHWYEVTLIHFTPDSLTEFYLDGEKVFELHVPLVRNMTDGDISNTNFASGLSFKGYWRNLRIYGSEGTSAIRDMTTGIQEIKVFPNPAHSSLQYVQSISNASFWSVSGFDGKIVMTGNPEETRNEIDIHALIPGTYVLQLHASSGMILARKEFVKI